LVNGNQPAPAAIGMDYSNTTSLASASGSGSGYTATVVSQNGYPAGTLSNITIGQDGTVTGAFTNGQNKTLAQVALATFQNEGGLQRAGSNGFHSTANSGLAQIGSGASGRFGSIVSGSLEESNVSLADEFTKMIVAQRAFEANSKSISTADQMLQTAVQMKQ
jgi:flagellar hook protein FlgE